MILVLKDNTVVSAIDSLIKLCNQYGITLLATDLDSVDKGAALAFGVKEYDYGVDAAKKAQLILEENKHPSDVPSTPAQNHKIKLNTQVMHKQGLSLSKITLFLMQSSIVI